MWLFRFPFNSLDVLLVISASDSQATFTESEIPLGSLVQSENKMN